MILQLYICTSLHALLVVGIMLSRASCDMNARLDLPC